MFSVVSEERLKLALQLAKRDIKRRHLEEQVKQQVFGGAVGKPLLAQKSQQQKTEVFESPENKNALKSQTCLKYQQNLSQPSQMESTTSGAEVSLSTAGAGKPVPAGLGAPPTRATGPDPRPTGNKKEGGNLQEVRRLQRELRSYVQKIEELTKKGVRLSNNNVVKVYSSLLICFPFWFFWLRLESVFSSGFLRTICFFQK